MNILFFTSEYNHYKLPASGGAGTFIKILAKELSLRGHKVFVFGISENKNIKFNDDKVEVNFIYYYQKRIVDSIIKRLFRQTIFVSDFFVKYRKIKNRRYWAEELKKYLIDKNIDIIEAWDYQGDFLFLNKLNLPLVIRCHGSAAIFKKHFNYLGYKNYLIEIEKMAIKKSNNLIAVSEYSKKINQEYFKKKNIKLIYNGIDTNLFKPNTNESIIKYSIFYFGTVSEQKGLKRLAEIFNKIALINPLATLHIIGRGEKYTNYLKDNILNEGALKKTRFYGPIERELLPKKLSKAHVIVLPTQGENFPFSFLEAMSLEKPLIVSNIDVSKEIIDHTVNGYIATTDEDFINYIELVFTNDSKSNLVSKRGRETIIENFTLEKMTYNTLDYYKKIIAKKV
jgi:glycosyltransferase involved in cell wall biosynthesis